jgi:hypothetical protein
LTSVRLKPLRSHSESRAKKFSDGSLGTLRMHVREIAHSERRANDTHRAYPRLG